MLGLLLKHRGDCGIADGEKALAVDTIRKITDRGIIVALVVGDVFSRYCNDVRPQQINIQDK